jgi:hypothetical protein
MLRRAPTVGGVFMRAGILCIAVAFAFALGGCSEALHSPPSNDALPQSAATKIGLPGKTAKVKPGDAVSTCPTRAIFVRRYAEIRGYPLDASGETAPCTIISGALSNVSDNLPYGDIAVSAHGYLHALSFQGNDERVLTIDEPDASGDAVPFRLVGLSPDAVALAVDSSVTDYVVAGENYQSDNCWLIVPSGATSTVSSNCDTNLGAIVAMAIDTHGDLIVAGPDAITGTVRFDVISNPALASFAVVRTIEGSENGIGPTATIALAVAPATGELYVFSRALNAPAAISVFSDGAQGNAEPTRTLVGSNANLPLSAFAVNVIAVDDAGYLYVSSVAGTIFVYGPGATGDAVPVRQITDAGAASHTFAAGIALRLAP